MNRVSLTETRVPLEGIAEAASELIELYGGHVTGTSDSELRFVLPVRRGAAASGGVESVLAWVEDDQSEGTVTLTSDQNSAPPTFQRIALLVAGVVGSVLWLIWPFFPAITPVAVIGGVIAFATYLITLRGTSSGASDLLQSLARTQRERAMEEPDGDEG